MDAKREELYVFQLLHFLVSKYQYQLVTVRQYKQDKWLMNPAQKDYPIIYLTSLDKEQLALKMPSIRQVHQVIAQLTQRNTQLLILHTSDDAEIQREASCLIAPIHPGSCEEEGVKACFEGIGEAVYDSPEPQKEVIQLTHSLEELQAASLRKLKQQGFVQKMPLVTTVTVGICMLVWLLVALLSSYLENDIIAALLGGAYYKMNIISLHEYWRMITAGFLHLDIIHLLCNMMALYSIGKVCERSYTKLQYLMILIGSIVIGNLFVFLTEGNSICLGISGGVFGLFGAVIVTLFADHSIQNPMVKASVMRLLVMNALISLLPGISLFAHLGGLVAGVFMGIIFTKVPRWAHLRIHVTISFAILVGLSFGMASKLDLIEPLDRQIDRTYYHTVKKLGLDSYAKRIQQAYLHYYSKEELGI